MVDVVFGAPKAKSVGIIADMNQPPALPFPRTWWIQPGRLLGGCYPGDLVPAMADQKLIALLDAGVCRVICLQPADETGRGGVVPGLVTLILQAISMSFPRSRPS